MVRPAERQEPQRLIWCTLVVGWHGAWLNSEKLSGSNSCKLFKGNRGVNLLCDHVTEEPLIVHLCKPQGQGCKR